MTSQIDRLKAAPALFLDYYLRGRGNAEPELKAADDALREAFARMVGERR